MAQSIAMHVNQATTLPGSPIFSDLPAPEVLKALPAHLASTCDNKIGAPIVDKSEGMYNAAQRMNCPFYYF